MDLIVLIIICIGVWKIANDIETVVKESKENKGDTDGN